MDHRQNMEDGAHAGYAVVPNDILTELLKLGEVAFKLWVCLARRCYGDRLECWPKIAVLEQELGFSRRAIFNAMTELEAASLITRQSRFRADGSQTSTVYLLARGASPISAPSRTPRGASSCTPGGEPGCTPIPLKKNKIEETKEEETLPFGVEFSDAWNAWKKYRRELRKPLTPSTIKTQLQRLSGYSESQAVETLQKAIERGWQGLVYPEQLQPKTRSGDVGVSGCPDRKLMTREDIDRAAAELR